MYVSQMSKIVRPLMNLVRLQGVQILQQLHLEERLLRTSSDNWCIINDGTNDPTIVMGISGHSIICNAHPWMQEFNLEFKNLLHRKPAELIEISSVIKDNIPVIKRFSGGGTVIVDRETIFVTLICNKDAIPGVQPYPQPIMSWSSLFYSKVFQGVGNFNLRENDYAFGNRKFGGNAQSITKNRWVHHTSFLWDYKIGNMAYLKHPKRAPEYRMARSHSEFICSMKDHLPRSDFIHRTMDALGDYFSVRSLEPEGTDCSSDTKFIQTSRLLKTHELETAALEFQSAADTFPHLL